MKRNRLLSDLERERLETRNSLDPHTRNTNDVRVKKKLTAWLDSLEDISLILKHMPSDQWRNITPSLKDEHVIVLFKLSEKLMDVLGYYGIEWSEDDPRAWVVTRAGFDERGFPIAAKDPRPATEKDIKQSLIMGDHALVLKRHRTGDKIIAFDKASGEWETLKKYYYATQDYDPAVMMAHTANMRDRGVEFPAYTPEDFDAMDKVAEILRSIRDPKFRKEEIPTPSEE